MAEPSDKSFLNSVYIGLGANINTPVKQIQSALATLAELDECKLEKYSSFYVSKPMGPQDQDDYINAVALLTTSLTPLTLLDRLQCIEKQQGRIRKGERWGPRTLDLDLLLYNNETIELPRLVVPHYGIKQRNFVLLPLFELSPSLIFPDGALLTELAKKIDTQGIRKL